MKIFKKLFTKDYWISSLNNFKDVKSIAFMSIMMALIIIVGGVCSLTPLKIFGREIAVTFLFWPIMGLLFGPIPSMVIAGIADILIYFIFPSGYAFYLGYTLTQVLLGFISGLFFYKSNVSIIKIIIYKLFINFGIHVGIESFFMKDIMKYTNDAFKTYLIGGATKNLIFLPFECIAIILLLIALLPIMSNLKLINDDIYPKVKIV